VSLRLFLLLLAGSLVTMPALAWDYEGHKVTAEVVYATLGAEERARLIAILESHPRFQADFVAQMPADADRDRWLLWQAASWPDLARRFPESERDNYHRGTWHYINHVVWLTDEDRATLDGTLAHNRSTSYHGPLQDGLNAVQALKGNLDAWHNPAASAADKAIALCWILHITGDLHQPLHNVALFSRHLFPEGDRGGNLIEVQWGQETRNLHYVWDSLVDDALDVDIAPAGLRTIPDGWIDNSRIERWSRQHANLARLNVYTGEVVAQLIAARSSENLSPISVSDAYLEHGRAISVRQLQLAGRRAASLIRQSGTQ
jgi:hypothetical protein